MPEKEFRRGKLKDWYRLIADEYQLMGKHYTKGRAGKKINKIVVHHNAGNLSIKDCYRVWQERPASAHYQVESSGRVGQLVRDSDTAYHAGNWETNLTSIGIEHANNKVGEPWTISQATLENGAHLVAALCHAYKLGVPAWGKNVFPHQHFMSTRCPGAINDKQRNEYMARAKHWYWQMSKPSAKAVQAVKSLPMKVVPAKYVKPTAVNIEQLAKDVIAGKYGNGVVRKRKLGKNYAAVQARVNQILHG